MRNIFQKPFAGVCGCAAVFALALTGCGGGSGNGSSSNTGSSANTIVFLGGDGIYSIQSNGSNQRPLTSSATDSSPSRSRNGSRIAFSSYRNDTDGTLSNGEIYTMDFTGANVLRLTNDTNPGGVEDSRPLISPDGNTIAWLSARDRTTTPPRGNNIWLMDATGTNQRRLTSEIAVTNFTWGRNSESIIYSAAQSTAANPNFQLKEKFITSSNELTLSTLGDFGDLQLSPDATRIAFNLSVNGTFQRGLKIFDVATGNVTNGPRVGENSVNPSWSPDGNNLVFEAGGRLYVAPPTPDATPRPITSTGFDLPSWNE